MDPVTLTALLNGVILMMDQVQALSHTVGRKVHPELIESQNQLRQLAVERAKQATRPNRWEAEESETAAEEPEQSDSEQDEAPEAETE